VLEDVTSTRLLPGSLLLGSIAIGSCVAAWWSIAVGPRIAVSPCTAIRTVPGIMLLGIVDEAAVIRPSSFARCPSWGGHAILLLGLGIALFRSVLPAPFGDVVVGRSYWRICRRRG